MHGLEAGRRLDTRRARRCPPLPDGQRSDELLRAWPADRSHPLHPWWHLADPFGQTAGTHLIKLSHPLAIQTEPLPTVAPTPAASASTTTSDTSGASCFKIDPVHPRLTPKPGFDPLTASDPELQAQDFPARPTNHDQLSVWEGYAKKYLAGEVINCATPGPDDIPPQYRTLAHAISVGPQPRHK